MADEELTLDDVLRMVQAEENRRLLESLPQASQNPPQGGVSVDRAALAELGQGISDGVLNFQNDATLGFLDDLTGAANAVGPALRGEDPQPYIDAGREHVRGELAEAWERSPVASGMGRIMGSLAAAAVSIPATLGRGMMSTMARMGGIGAAEGALAGAGHADGEDVLLNAGAGAVIGGGAGALGVPAVAAGRGLLRTLAQPVEALARVGNRGRAGGILARAMDRANLTPAQLNSRMLEAANDHMDAYRAMDAMGYPGQRTAAAVARSPGQGQAELQEFLATRQAGQGDRIGSYIADVLPADETAASRVSRLTDERGAAADVNYPAARQGASPVDVRGALAVIDDRLGPMRNDAGIVGDGIDAILLRYRSRLAGMDGGNAVELSDFSRVLGVKRDLNDDIGAAVQAGRREQAAALTQLRNELDAALEAASPGYRLANDTFREQSRAIDAVETGQQANRPSQRYEDVIRGFDAMNPAEQESFRSGYADRLLNRIEGATPGTNVARAFTTPRVEGIMRGIIPNGAAGPNNTDQFFRRIARENEMFETNRLARGGSMTADNMADQADIGADVVGLMTNPQSTAVQAVMRGIGDHIQGYNEQTRLLVARALMSRDPSAELQSLVTRGHIDTATARLIEGALRNSGYQAVGLTD